MFDPDVFAVLTPVGNNYKAISAFRLSHNSKWFCEAVGGVAEKPTISSREVTPFENPEGINNEKDRFDSLVLTFDKLLHLEDFQNGITFGTNPASSHILLGYRGTRGASARQCNIVVDEDLQILLEDYYSTYGTAVSYDGQNEDEIRKNERWILAHEPGAEMPFQYTSIHSGKLGIRVQFPNHEKATPTYVKNLKALRKKCRESKEAGPSVLALDLNSRPTTQKPTGARTPGKGLLYFEGKCLGEGAFGEVHRVIRLRDGKVLASKTFKPPSSHSSKRVRESDQLWLEKIRKEYTFMKDNPHPNVIQVFDMQESPNPKIYMTYFPYGNIADAGISDKVKYITAFGQVLDGLAHLHTRNIVHRDLKPDNFLVEEIPYFKVVIADFGLANVVTDTTPLTSFCGSLPYIAPEIFPTGGDGYGPPADIWSLGVIVLGWLYGLPAARGLPGPMLGHTRAWSSWSNNWTARLLRQLGRLRDNTMTSMLSQMICVDPSKRNSAAGTLDYGLNWGEFKRREADNLVISAKDEYNDEEDEEDAMEEGEEQREHEEHDENDEHAAAVSTATSSVKTCTIADPRGGGFMDQG